MRYNARNLGIIGLVYGLVHGELLQGQAAREGPYARYQPAQCAYIAHSEEQAWWHQYNTDTVLTPRTGYVWRPATIAAVRSCLAQFTVTSVPLDQLLGYGQGLLVLSDTVRADSAFTRLVASATSRSVDDRAWMLLQIVYRYLDDAVPLFGPVTPYLAQLDALGAPAAGERMLAYQAVAERARRRDSVDLESKALLASIAASRELRGPALTRYGPSAAGGYAQRAEYFVRQGQVDSARAVFDRAQQALGAAAHGYYLGGGAIEWLRLQRKYLDPVGRTAPQIVPARWDSVDHGTIVERPGTKRPTTGRPSLVIFDAKPGISWEGPAPGYTIVKRLASIYGPRGIDVTFISWTERAWHGQLVSVDSQMTFARTYFLTEQALPVMFAMAKQTRGDPLVRTPSVNVAEADQGSPDDAYQPPVDPSIGLIAYLIDSKGIVQFVTPVRRQDEAVLDHMLAKLR